MRSHLSVVVLIPWATGVLFRKLPVSITWSDIFIFQWLQSFGSMVKTLIYLELIFAQNDRCGSRAFLYHVDIRFFAAPLELIFFPIVFILPSLFNYLVCIPMPWFTREIRGHVWAGSLLPSHGFWGLNSSHQAWRQASLSTEPSHWPTQL